MPRIAVYVDFVGGPCDGEFAIGVETNREGTACLRYGGDGDGPYLYRKTDPKVNVFHYKESWEMPMGANHVEFMDGPCTGDKVVKATLTLIGDNSSVSITRWVGDVLHQYELRGNKAYYVNIIKGMD